MLVRKRSIDVWSVRFLLRYGVPSPERAKLIDSPKRRDLAQNISAEAEFRLLNPTEQRRQIRFLQRAMELLSETRSMEQSLGSLKERRRLLKRHVLLLRKRLGELERVFEKLRQEEEREREEVFGGGGRGPARGR